MLSTSCGFSWSAPRIGQHDLGLVAEPVGERRAQRAVGETAGEDGVLGGTALTTEERAGDLAGGVGPLLDVDRQREEVRARADVLGGVGGGQHGGATEAGDDGALLCWASLPVSKDRVLSVPDTGPDTRMASAMSSSFRSGALSSRLGGVERRPVPSRRCRDAVRRIARAAAEATDNRSVARSCVCRADATSAAPDRWTRSAGRHEEIRPLDGQRRPLAGVHLRALLELLGRRPDRDVHGAAPRRSRS